MTASFLQIYVYMYTYMYMCSYMRNLLLRLKKTRLHCGLFIVPYSMMTSPNSFQCLNRSVTWGKVKQEEKIVFKSWGRRKKHLEKKLSAGVEEAKKHRGLNILLLQTFCTSCVRFYCRWFLLLIVTLKMMKYGGGDYGDGDEDDVTCLSLDQPL